MPSLKRARVDDHLTDDFPQATTQERFALVLHERLGSLELQVDALADALQVATDAMAEPQSLVAWGCHSCCVFAFRCTVSRALTTDRFAGALMGGLASAGARLVACRHDVVPHDTSVLEALLESPTSFAAATLARFLAAAGASSAEPMHVMGLLKDDAFLRVDILQCSLDAGAPTLEYRWDGAACSAADVDPMPEFPRSSIVQFPLHHPLSITSEFALP